MNLIIIPFHDWRKIKKEGFRTRDAHFIEVLSKRKAIKKVIINRPITFLEIFLKGKNKKIEGKLLLKKGGLSLYEIESNTYLIDFISKDVFNQVIHKFNWYINSYNNKKYVSFIKESLKFLGIQNYQVYSQNIFSYKLANQIKDSELVFDAWDNFTKFKVYSNIIGNINEGYNKYSLNSDFWITNANENMKFFSENFNVKRIHLINNGVDLNRFVLNKENFMPRDLAPIKKPIVGFGGKMTQLIDVDLLNKLISITPEVSFVFIGQILDKKLYDKILKPSNFYYLGDKHYDSYHHYVKNFDVCIVPYVTQEDKKSGANSIKVYEYLATGKKVVGTKGNGLEDLKDYLFIANTAEEFSYLIKDYTNNPKKSIDLECHSWETKVNQLLELLENESSH